MKHFLKLDSAGVVWGYSQSDQSPGDGWVEVSFEATGVMSSATKMRLVNGALVDTGQPTFPPHPWMTWDATSVSWVDSRGLEQLKTAQWEVIKAARDAAEFSEFTWDGSEFDADALSQQRIIGAAQLAEINPTYEVDWTLANNNVRTLNATQMKSVGVALGAHVNAQHVKARGLRQQIQAATTREEVEAVTW